MTDELRRRALQLIARREHTRAELQRRLARSGATEDVAAELDKLEDSGLVSDPRFVEVFVASRAARCGDMRLRHELRIRGVAEDLIERALREGGDESARARAVWERKFGTPPTSNAEYARHARFLQSRGFSSETVRQVLRKRPE